MGIFERYGSSSPYNNDAIDDSYHKRISSLQELVTAFSSYNKNSSSLKKDVEKIKLAFNFADQAHINQKRESDEPYIVHPLNVAYILTNMHADADTICAALLHDTLEDTELPKEVILENFGDVVLNLVEGVTKINYEKTDESKIDNRKKVLEGIGNDIRIIFIKLADRVDNMRTLEFKKDPMKRIAKAEETLDIYVPLANNLGVYKIQQELEDLSLRYKDKEGFKVAEEQRDIIINNSTSMLEEMKDNITRLLTSQGIKYDDSWYRIKNVYSIYNALAHGNKASDIHDLFALKVVLSEIQKYHEDCYRALGLVHSLYTPKDSLYHDFICSPKTNFYQSLHTTVWYHPIEQAGTRFYRKLDMDETKIQVQIRDKNMERKNTWGLAYYFDAKKREEELEKFGPVKGLTTLEQFKLILKNETQFYKSLESILTSTDSDKFKQMDQVKSEVLSKQIYVFTPNGSKIQLPAGSTVLTFALKSGLIVNEDDFIKAIIKSSEDSIIDNNAGKDTVLLDGQTVEIIKKADKFDRLGESVKPKSLRFVPENNQNN